MYSGQPNAWMTSKLFHEWFHQHFVPYVQKSLEALGEKCRSVLLLDNCSAHPQESELVTEDGEIFAYFLPANVTSLIQPMDQGVLQALKMKYTKRKLLRRLIIEDNVGGSIIDLLKSINMKIVVELIAESWDEIQSATIRKSWQKIIPQACSTSTTDASKSHPIRLAPGSNLPDTLVDALHQGYDELTKSSDMRPLDSIVSKTCFLWHGIRV
jgi:hypothetical protein